MRHLGASVVSEMWEKVSDGEGWEGKEKGNFNTFKSKCGGRGILGAPDVDGLGEQHTTSL